MSKHNISKNELLNRMLKPNGNDSIKYADVYILKSIYCKACDSLLEMKSGVTICLTKQELIARAELEHKNACKDCLKKQLLINYDNTLISKALYDELART